MLRQRACRLEVSRFAHNRALHYLARAREYRLSDLLRQQLTHVVEGYLGRCDEEAARGGSSGCANSIAPRVSGRDCGRD
jgi:hypothetical protein